MLEEITRGSIFVEDIEIGMQRRLRKEVTMQDIQMFANVSLDHNPVHLDDDFAKTTRFKGCVAHGMLSAGLISAVIGEQLPGHGSVYMGQTLRFMAPVRPGDIVVAEVEVTGVDRERHRVSLDCRCMVGDTVVIKGEALVLAPSRKSE